MILTAQVVNDAPKFLNPEKLYTIQLRGLHIQYLENLGITNDQYEVLDFTGNDLVTVGNIPLLSKAKTLLFGNNKIVKIEGLGDNLPGIESLLFMANEIAQLESIVSLSQLHRLTHLVMLDNPITQIPYYRLFTIWTVPSLKSLDFEKVKEKERQAAVSLFGTSSEPTPLYHKLLNNTNAAHEPVAVETHRKLTDEEKKELVSQLEKAKDIEEIERIEMALATGYLEKRI